MTRGEKIGFLRVVEKREGGERGDGLEVSEEKGSSKML